MLKKHLTFISLVVLLFCSTLSKTEAAPQNVLEPLNKFNDFFQSENLPLDEWQIMMRETIVSTENPVKIIQDLFPNETVKKESNKHSNKYFTSNVHKNGTMTESVSIVVDINNPKQWQLFYVISGKEMNSQIEEMLLLYINRAHSQFFTKNPSIFTCMKAKTSDNIRSNFIVDKFQQFTTMKKIKSLNEPNFITISGFIHTLNVNSIPISHKENMNVQMAVRNSADSGTTITIGTPILTIEY